MSAAHTWDTLKLCWIDVYTGPSDIIVHDAGTNFSSSEFRQNASAMAIAVKCVPVEAPQSVGMVERYHGPLRRAYNIITDELKNQTSTKEIRLQMAEKPINDTALVMMALYRSSSFLERILELHQVICQHQL